MISNSKLFLLMMRRRRMIVMSESARFGCCCWSMIVRSSTIPGRQTCQSNYCHLLDQYVQYVQYDACPFPGQEIIMLIALVAELVEKAGRRMRHMKWLTIKEVETTCEIFSLQICDQKEKETKWNGEPNVKMVHKDGLPQRMERRKISEYLVY